MIEMFSKLCGEYDLTPGEKLKVIAEFVSGELGGEAKYMIREERHGDAGVPGGRGMGLTPEQCRDQGIHPGLAGRGQK